MSGADRGRRRRHVHRRDPPRGRRARPGAQAALDAAELRPGGGRGRLRARRARERRAPASTRSCTARPSPRTPSSSASAPRPRSSRPSTSATSSSCAGCGSRTCTTSSGRKPPPLVERRLRFEVAERMAADGTVVKALDDGEVRALAGAAAGARDRLGRRLLPPLVPLSRARAARRRDPGRGAARGDDLALERDPARAARVRAVGDDGRQRLRAAADVVVHRPDPHRPRRDRAGRTPRSRSCSRPAA